MSATTLAGTSRLATRSSFYFYLSLVFVAIAFGGFARTYLVPVLTTSFDGPPLLHVHGILFLSWTVLFAVQTKLTERGRVDRHRALGLLGISLATAMVFTALAVIIRGIDYGAATGNGVSARTLAVVPVSAIALFAVLFCCAIANLRRPETHKRLMTLATIALLPPAVARILLAIFIGGGRPNLGSPVDDIGLVLTSAIAAAFIVDVPLLAVLGFRDWRTLGRVHRVYWIGGTAVLLVQVLRIPLARTELWQWTMSALAALGA